MTGRERLRAILNKRPTDKLSWTTLVDHNTLNCLPSELQELSGVDFYRHLGCDIFQLGGWDTPYHLRSPELQWGWHVTLEQRKDSPEEMTIWHTPQGSLTAVYDRGHPRKYPVDSLEAIHTYRRMWEDACYVAIDDREAFSALDQFIGADGVVTRFWGPSTIPHLLEFAMGTENFYLLMADYPADVEGLIRIIHERELQAFTHLADGPWESVTLVENTSTFYVSPHIYATYNMPHQRDFVDITQQRGKVALLHMCGHIHSLLDMIKETGCDGIHTLTPPPTGDTPWEKALDIIGEDLIIIGCLDPTVFVSGPISEIGPALDQLITPRLREANFLLNPMADGIPVEIERFYAIKRWMDAHAEG